jgi:transcriptional regulator with XRE-family HTH domain
MGLNELARVSSVSGAQISRAENGDDPTPPTIIVCALAEAMGIRTAWLLLGEEPMRDAPLRLVQTHGDGRKRRA